MTLYTDQPQPHVHVVVKAVSEEGTRPNIRKATLREWRREFAAHLRQQGVEANATERAVRGVSKPHETDGIFRAATRGESTHYRERAWTVADELRRGGFRSEPGLTTLTQTREAVIAGWHAVADALDGAGRRDEAKAIRRFVAQMPPVRTEMQWIADRMLRSLGRLPQPSQARRTLGWLDRRPGAELASRKNRDRAGGKSECCVSRE
ncbi:MAG TPA: hypothetical protein VG994_09205 [Steroidobacteraceae bacterium]|nr:hypothetical protein [Steroidobacteraceae bacterium]